MCALFWSLIGMTCSMLMFITFDQKHRIITFIILGINTMAYLLNIERSFQSWFNFISYENRSKVQVTSVLLEYFDKLITMITCKRNNSQLHFHKNTNYIHKNTIIQTLSTWHHNESHHCITCQNRNFIDPLPRCNEINMHLVVVKTLIKTVC